MGNEDSKTPRFAIKFGSSASREHDGHQFRQPTHGGRRQRVQGLHALQEDSHSEDEDEKTQGPHVSIRGYGPDGAKDDKTIQRKQNGKTRTSRERDVAHNSASKSGGTRGQGSHGNQAADVKEEEEPIKYGLTINKKQLDDRRDIKKEEYPRGNYKKELKREEIKKEDTAKTADEEAFESLLQESNGTKRKRDDLEDLKQDPDEIDYKAVPVDDFGANLLKKFGWDGKMRGKVQEVHPRHANLAGLGAKNAKGAEDLGTWDQKGQKDERRPRLADHRRNEDQKRARLEERHVDSYKHERDRARDPDRGQYRDRDRR